MKKTIVILFCLFFSLELFSQNMSGSTVDPPADYKLTPVKEFFNQQKTNADLNADILLVQTSLPWNSNANTIVLDQLGYVYDVADISNISNINLFDYPVILIVNDQTQAFYDKYQAEKQEFENYVANGGSLLFFAASDGWAGGTLYANLPGEVELVTPHYENYNYINDQNHPIVSAALSDNIPLIDSDLYNTYCSHGYFSALPDDANVILVESHNYPTLVEYSFGQGKVVASTLTWEHAYNYGRAFAIKALDDVFLYMFSQGYNPNLSNLEIELRVEDANPEIMVNKIEGVYVDVVAKIYNRSEEIIEDVNSMLLFEQEDFFSEMQILSRSQQSGLDENEIGSDYSNLNLGDIQPGDKMEVVFRFKIKDDIIPDHSISIDILDIEFSLQIESLDYLISSNTAKLRLWERLGSLIVTNRSLLYKNYNEQEVNDLLAKLYEISELGNEYPGVIYYVDRYSELAKNWDQEIDYFGSIDEINAVANAIDSEIEKWYKQQTFKLILLPVGVKPGYLTIVGGDEIIPYHRVNNADYRKDNEEINVFINGPIADAYLYNYFLTDNVYAETDGNFKDCEKGDLDLAIGRIVGHDARTMQKFIRNSFEGHKALETSLVAALGPDNNLEFDHLVDALEDHGSTILGESNPDLLGNDLWTENQFYTELKKDFQVLSYNAHSDVDVLQLCNGFPGDLYTKEMKLEELNNFNENSPFVSLLSCHGGVVLNEKNDKNLPEPNDCLPYKFIDLGISGLVASTGFASYNSSKTISRYGEKLINDFFKIAYNDNGVVVPLGMALTSAKSQYNFLIKTGTDKKALLEFVYYGLPWSTPNFSDKSKNVFSKSLQEQDFTSIDDQLTFNADSYFFEDFMEYEILQIEGCELMAQEDRPMIPFFNRSIVLPKNSTVNNIEISRNDSIDLGSRDFPQTYPGNMKDTIQYNSDYQFETYPETKLVYELQQRENYDVLVINYFPLSINGANKEVVLYNNTSLEADIELGSTIILKSFEADENSFGMGDSILFNTDLINISDSSENISLVITINDTQFAEMDEVIESGNSQRIKIPCLNTLQVGFYEAIMSVLDEKNEVIAASIAEFNVLDGKIEKVSFPDTIYRSEIANVDLVFSNLSDGANEISAFVKIFDSNGENVLNLIKQSQTVDQDTQELFTWDWSTVDLSAGNYKANIYVESGNVNYGPVEELFYIENSVAINSMFPEQAEIKLCTVPDLTIELDMQKAIRASYQWYHDDILLEGQNDSILNIPDFAVEDEGDYYCNVYNEIDTVWSDTLNVMLGSAYQIEKEISICYGESYFVNNGYQTEEGVYTDTLFSISGCDSIVKINLLVNELPEIEITGDHIGCEGTVLSLDAGANHSSYSWNNGENTQVIEVKDSDLYTVTVSNESGCATTDSIEVTFYENPNVSVSGKAESCFGNTEELDAGEGYEFYSWSTGEETQIIQVTESGTYDVTITDRNGCTGEASHAIDFQHLPIVDLGNDTTITPDQSLTLDAGDGYSYIWSTGETTQTIRLENLEPGIHFISVIVSTSASCEANDQITVTVEQASSLSNIGFGDKIKIYPNPTNRYVNLEIDVNSITDIIVSVIDVSGKTVINKKINDLSYIRKARIDVSQLQSGLYLIEVNTPHFSGVGKFVKK